jgi:hypothetical protein
LNNKTPFFAIVGAQRADKVMVFEALQRIPELAHYAFLTESFGTHVSNDRTNPFVRELTRLIETGIPAAHATPHSQLKLFWSRLSTVIDENVAPTLLKGTPVIMKGFGGSALARAAIRSKSATEREKLIHHHKENVATHVKETGIWPPIYLHLERDPFTAYKMHHIDEFEMEYMAQVNFFFKFYGTLPGQKVVIINADQDRDLVLKEVLSHIMPQHELALAG